MDGLNLIEQARVAGLEIRRDGERLVIRGPKEAEKAAKLVFRQDVFRISQDMAQPAGLIEREMSMRLEILNRGAHAFAHPPEEEDDDDLTVYKG